VKAATLFVIGFISPYALCTDSNPRDLVAQSITNYEKDWKAALDFTYLESEVTKDPSGHPKSVEISQVNVLNGTPYSRLIARDGHPLDAEQDRKEADKYRKVLDTREGETPEQRAHRISKYEDERQFLYEIPEAFNMKLLGHETLNGRPNYVIALTPKRDYIPKSRNARIFPDIEGKLWIDEQDLRWTQADAYVIDPVSFGWILARIGPGAHITMKQVKVDGDHWMPKEIDVSGVAKILLVKNHTVNQTITYDNYKRLRPPPPTAAAKNR
jgi:hypothetical protein